MTVGRSTNVTFRAFGAPTLRIGDTPVRFGVRRGFAALAFLLETDRPVPRAALGELLWPDEADGVARERLRRLVHRLGEAAGRRLIVAASGDGLTVAPDLRDRYDVGNFRRAALGALDSGTAEDLERAAAAAGPNFLDGLAFDDGGELDDWITEVRIEIDSLVLRVLRRRAEVLADAGSTDAAIAAARALVARDPLRESSHRLLLRLMLAAGDDEGAEAHFRALEDRLRSEVGAEPSAPTRALLAKASRETTLPRVRYAPTPGGVVAYAVAGTEGPALIMAPGFVSHIEMAWEDPPLRDALRRLSERRRVIIFDRRGQGLSERLGVRQSLDEAARDIHAIVAAEGLEQFALFGASEGGPTVLRVAHARPNLVDRIVLFGSFAKGSRGPDYPYGLSPLQFDRWRQSLVSDWGGPASLAVFAPTRARDPAFRAWWARLLRQATTPVAVAATLAAIREMDVRPILGKVRAPSLVLHRARDRAIRIGAGRALSAGLPNARFVDLPGDDHWWWCGDADSVLAEIDAFLG